MKALRFAVFGRVQGVGFRAFTRRVALRHNLVGWARNCSNGSVDILLVGDSENIAKARANILRGPALSQVERSAALPTPTTLPTSDFEVG
ncbi:acylphosphatase [Litorivivens sp.]|uniref:acylphosphatase n=1 Tax=Litorivivens sp. TaxID=2020868 RepID=UPI003569396C